jgi:DNA-binding transcriptional MerR regulator
VVRSEGNDPAATGGAPRDSASEPDGGPSPAPLDRRQTYTIDELATVTGVASRTIRYYQAEGLLPWPTKQGRIALYGPDHVERLELIATLQSRGLQLSAIAALLSLDGPLRVSVRQWLGLQAEALAQWVDKPITLERGDLLERLGGRETLVDELIRATLLHPDGADERYVVPRPRLLEIALQMEAAGVEIGTSSVMAQILTDHLSAAVADLLVMARERLGNGFGSYDPQQLRLTLDVVDRLAVEAVGLLFAEQLSDAVGEFQRAATVVLDDATGIERSMIG